MALADLHMHSTASDGLLRPAEIVAKAWNKQLRTIALTDHDTTSGIEEALEAGRNRGLNVIPGLELSCEDERGTAVHILGYKIDYKQKSLQRLLMAIEDSRVERVKMILQRLNNHGFQADWAELVQTMEGVKSPGRPHIARLMVKRGFTSTVSEAFTKWLNPGCPAYIPRYKLTPCQGIKVIQEASGLAFLAHPGLIPTQDWLELITHCGLDGIEVYHPAHKRDQVKQYLNLARNSLLLISGGSDFHGNPGEEVGAVAVNIGAIPWILD